MAAKRTHDADLCERIRRLEERVRELEAQPSTVYIPALPHYCWPGCPTHHPYWWTVSTSGTSWTGNTVTFESSTAPQMTYTGSD